MEKVFVKKGELKLVNGGYVVAGKDETPVNNPDFIAAQKRAEYVITFAEMAKGKDFKGKKADSIEDLRSKVLEKVSGNTKVEYVSAGDKPSMPTKSKLAKEALAFIEYDEKKEQTAKINNFLQEFNILKEFSEFGLFFDKDIVKLNKIYTIEEVVTATESVINLL